VITRADIVQRVAEWQMTEEVIEKDYVLGWLLWGIGADSTLGNRWVFKGGTCLKKCYIETHRFSEDLDFTVLPGGPFRPEEIKPLLVRTLERVHQASGIDFSLQQPTLRLRPDGLSTEGRVYYVGPRRTRQAARVKLDISANETVVRPPVLLQIAHPYPDGPLPGPVRCYSFEEVFAEKLRAMGQRGRPRDLYDIINLFRRDDLRLYPDLIRETLREKCEVKSVAVPTADDFIDSPRVAELEADWANMLGHQLPALPPLEGFLEELPNLFGWLEGAVFEELPAVPRQAGEQDWSPPPTVYVWGVGVPLETVRFAAANHLLVDLTYDGRRRLIEPYSLRRSSEGRLLLHAEHADGSGHRTYGVDKITGLKVTTTPFRPRTTIEFSSEGPLHAPPQSRSSGTRTSSRQASRARATRQGPKYVYRCLRCHREFMHMQRQATLRAHVDSRGYPCRGRRGTYVATKW